MSTLLFFLSALVGLCLRLTVTNGQISEVTCTDSHAWMKNSLGQDPCGVAAWLSFPCQGPGSTIAPLDDPQNFYSNSPDDDEACWCNSVMYSMIQACQLCQYDEMGVVLRYSGWSGTGNCTNVTVQAYPPPIPSGTGIPAWAFLDVTVMSTIGDEFNLTKASIVANAGLPDATPPVSTTTSSSSTTTTTSTTAPTDSSTSSSTSSSSPTATPAGASSSSTKSNVGPIVGGVVGSVLGLFLIGILAYYLLLRQRNLSHHTVPPSQAGDSEQPTSPTLNGARPVTPGYGAPSLHSGTVAPRLSTSVLYDPNNPRTFPLTPQLDSTMDSFGAQSALMRETSFVDRYPTIGSVFSHPAGHASSIYKGSPEL